MKIEPLFDVRLGSAERLYPTVRRAQQVTARRDWLESAEDFHAITKRLMGELDADKRERINRVLSQLGPARNAIRRITRDVGELGAGIRHEHSRTATAPPRVGRSR